MPVRPGKSCRKTNCPNIASHTQHQGYCEQHKDSAGWHANEKAKGNRHQRGYGNDWTKIRTIVLDRDRHLCVQCKTEGIIKPASQVDHIKPKALGGTNALSNLQSLCKHHHREKTAKERVICI